MSAPARSAGRGASIVAAAAMLVGCASPRAPLPDPIVGVDIRSTALCDDDAVVPQIIGTRPADLPASVWDARALTAFEAQVSFRIDEHGVPVAIHVSAGSRHDGDVIAQAVIEALAGYRFCKPVAYAIRTEWVARMLFRPGHAKQVSSGEYYIQLFVPAYTRDDVHAGRSGTTHVRAVFAADGRPATLRVVVSSGDAVLDRKSLDSMASEQLVFRAGTVFTPPLALEQPYKYVIH